MANQENAILLVNPGGRVVEVTADHAKTLLASGEGFAKAPKGAKAGEMLGTPEVEPAQNNLVPNGTDEEKAAEIAALQGTQENVKLNAAADDTNSDVVPPADDEDAGDGVDNSDDDGAKTETEDAPAPEGKIKKFFGRK